MPLSLEMNMDTFWNMAHIIGGAAFAFLVIAVCRKRFQPWVTILFTALIGFVVNLIWELVIDVYGWFAFLGLGGDADIGDVIRGSIASMAIAVFYIFVLRKQKGTWRF